MRDRRCQLLPVQWRASLDLTDTKSQEDKEHSMDNRFTMADITIAKSIPVVRELTNSVCSVPVKLRRKLTNQVLLDIPMYMSQHREKMIEAVCSQANKLYRLWIARNPDFEANGGRVHIVGHSVNWVVTCVWDCANASLAQRLLRTFYPISRPRCPLCRNCRLVCGMRRRTDSCSTPVICSYVEALSVSFCTWIRHKSCRGRAEIGR